ncbi:beta-1,4-N-acetylgalactosaminyltransferase bre-4 isoform X7 [Dermacentor silvarum]|uniref:beta-1,4-N-acetylgalactosaminyltransferase bre-4 isoform X7 n=1 Tax=Dermacentor silvarum TaxID=543639 RepID=UPI002100A980|nr:beta-1,4-N-acetylgalactosaminyltransferase bre-4 isoform X7 [Dermacentor silvarum]
MVLAERIGSGEAEKGRGIAGDSWALAKTHFCKIVVASLVPFTMMHWCLDVTQLKMTVKRASPQLPWHSEVISLSGKNHERSLKLTGVPKDVLTDSRRANVSSVNLCPLISPNLVGDIPIKMDVPSLEAVENEFPEVGQGGRFGPKECTSRHRVAILVPYRNRSKHLKIFIYNIHKVLSRQQIDYGIFVIEQGDAAGFNRAKLLNVGYVESAALYGYQCFIFHDVDMVPLDDRNVYTCPEQPRHMSVNVNNKSTVYYSYFFGGVSAVNKQQMLRVNGYSNKYWGWGAEDDDMAYRRVLLQSKLGRDQTSLRNVQNAPTQ